MKRKLLNYSVAFVFLFSLTSCATYEKKIAHRGLNKKNISQLEGTYLAVSTKDSVSDVSDRWYVYDTNFLKEIDRQKKDDTLSFTNNDLYTFSLKLDSPKVITVEYIVNDSIVRERDIKMKIRNNGYIQLKNKNLIFKGYPPLFWAYDQKKVRLTIDKDMRLVMDTASDSFGAFLLMVGGNRSSQRYRFEKIN